MALYSRSVLELCASQCCKKIKKSFNDDEPIVATQDDSGEKPTSFVAGKTLARIFNKTKAPLEESKFKVMLELTGAGSINDRPGVDLVMVLDLSTSMKGEKLEKLKTSMQFVIKKLTPIDRLSVVTFAGNSKRLCPLRQITKSSQAKIKKLVNALAADGNTNITAGLRTGLKVLNDRNLTSRRVVGIMLMSDGDQNAGGDAANVRAGNVPVHTFGFGLDQDPRVLKAIADNSKGGTFSDVQNENNLSIAFSQCLAGLLTVVVQDLKLTVTRGKDESTIQKVSAGNYPQSMDASSVSISFGDLYDKEVRKVLVDLLLPAVSIPRGADVLRITYTYRAGGKLYEANPLIVMVSRIGTSVEPEREEVKIEENRLRTAQMMKEARIMADEKKLDDAQNKIVEAENSLGDAVDESNVSIKMLKSELQQLSKLMKSQNIYEKQGRPFALSSETSHDRQRFATRGDVEKLRLFATPRMENYCEQAKSFNEDPSRPLPTLDEDVKQELAADPLSEVVEALSYFIPAVIQSLNSIENILNRGH
ncbi:hypothetical protein UlMin_028065 [Ulmus minor]